MKENKADSDSFNQDPFSDLAKAFYSISKNCKYLVYKFHWVKTAFHFSLTFMKHCKASGEHTSFLNHDFFSPFFSWEVIRIHNAENASTVAKREEKL